MNSIQEILSFRRENSEDYYSVLGCDPSSSTEQILAEYKVRAKQLHPDKQEQQQQQQDQDEKNQAQEQQDCSEFQLLQEAKETLTDPEKRNRYDKWLHSGLSISFKQWESLKGAVHSSMHWATPKTIGRMLSMQKDKIKKSFEDDSAKEEEINKDEVDELLDDNDDDASALVDTGDDREMDPEDIEYEARPYESLGFTVGTPPPGMFKTEEEKTKEEEEAKKKIFQARVQGSSSSLPPSSSSSSSQQASSTLGTRRQAFAQRRDSSVSSMHIVVATTDDEMRRRFRNYEI